MCFSLPCVRLRERLTLQILLKKQKHCHSHAFATVLLGEKQKMLSLTVDA